MTMKSNFYSVLLSTIETIPSPDFNNMVWFEWAMWWHRKWSFWLYRSLQQSLSCESCGKHFPVHWMGKKLETRFSRVRIRASSSNLPESMSRAWEMLLCYCHRRVLSILLFSNFLFQIHLQQRTIEMAFLKKDTSTAFSGRLRKYV